MSRPSTPLSFEDQLLAAVKKGEVSQVNELIDKRDELDLNVNCKDINGQSALNIAITEGNLVVIYPLLESNVRIGDALLRAVDNDFVEAVRLLCEYAKNRPSARERMDIIDCHCENDDFHPDVTPIVLAAQRNNFSMIKMLVEVGARIPELTADTFQTAATDSLQQSVGGLELYKGLASDAYVVLSSDDPINRCFTLSSNLRKLSEIEEEFKLSYLELIDKMEHCSQELIGQARSTEEILTILTSQESEPIKNGKGNGAKVMSTSPLPTISRAIELEQRKFIASPNCQQAIISQFYRRLIYLRDKSAIYRILFLFFMLLLHPFLALLYLYVPKKKIKEFVTTPYIKFILYVGSDILLVICLTMEAVLDKGVPYLPTLTEPYKIVICIWMLGLAVFEVNVMLTQNARKQILQWRHIRDICIVICFLYAVVFDAIAYSVMDKENINNTDVILRSRRHVIPQDSIGEDVLPEWDQLPDMPYAVSLNLSGKTIISSEDIVFNLSNMYPVVSNTYTNRRVVGRRPGSQLGRDPKQGGLTNIDDAGVLDRAWNHPQLISRALFTMATVVSIARIYPYLVVSDLVGPLKISLGSMVARTSHFFLVVGLVLLSFAVGLTYIYSYYNKTDLLRCQQDENTDKSCKIGAFNNLMTSLVTLYWSIFGLHTLELLELEKDAAQNILEKAGFLMYATFYVFVVVVLLNALIAVMSQVYTEVEENADEEWKFSCTEMWMGFMEDVNPLPPPYNLLPSYENMVTACGWFIRKYRWKSDREKLMSSSKQAERELTRTFLRESRKRSDEQSKERRYKKIVALLVDRYVTDKTSGESSTTADVTSSDVRGLKNDLIALRYETFLKMCQTHDYLVHVAGDCLGIHGQSKGTYHIFEKTDVIEEIVRQHAKSVYDFHTTLRETVAQLPPPPTPPPELAPEGSSKISKLIKYYDKGTKTSGETGSSYTEIKIEASGVDAALLGKQLERSRDSRSSQRSSGDSIESLLRKQFQLSPTSDSVHISGLQVPTNHEADSSVEVDTSDNQSTATPVDSDEQSEHKTTESVSPDDPADDATGESSQQI